MGAPAASYEYFVYQIAKDTILSIPTKGIEGIYDQPAYLKEYAVKKDIAKAKKPEARMVLMSGKRKAINILQAVNKRKEYVIQKYMEEKVGFLWWKRNRTREEAESEISLWWSKEMVLKGDTASLRKLTRLEELANTSIREGDGFVHLNKEDNFLIFNDGENFENH